jgi:thiol-disulfide isomerase/thioredoxin
MTIITSTQSTHSRPDHALPQIAWDPADGAKRYEVQMRLEGGGEGDFTTLSDKLLSTIVRKRNLKPGTRYEFRIRGRAGEGEADTSGSMSETIAASTAPEGEMRLPAPKMMGRDEGSITVKWEEVAGAESYEVSMRVGGGGEKWEVIAPALKQAIVRKKNLVVSDGGYFFRIKPVGASGMSFGLSEASACMHAAFLPEYFTKLFGGGDGTGNLVNAKGEKLLVGSLAGKVVAAYCSASWCPPCKQVSLACSFPSLAVETLERDSFGRGLRV